MLGNVRFRGLGIAFALALLVILIGCGGGGGSAGTTGLTGGATGGATGTTSGGTTSGGTTSGGTTSGGTTSGGTTSGGTTSGGTTSGGTTSGGTTSGGGAAWLAYDLNSGTTGSLFKIKTDGTGHAAVGLSGVDVESPKISSNGRSVVFFQSTSPADVYTANLDGTSLRNLTGTSGANNIDPNFSKDGTQVVFSSDRSGSFQIYTMSSTGANPQQLTNLAGGAFQPAISPDGLHIAFVSGTTNDEIFVMNADGTNVVQLTNGPAYQDQPSWSPDGTLIYFVQDFGSSSVNEQLMSILANGTGSINRLTSTMLDDRSPSVSADGLTLYFTRNSGGGREVFKMPAAGGAATAISSDGGFAQHVSVAQVNGP